MLIYDDLLGHHDKVKTAIQRIKTYNPLELGFDKPYYVCYSGGKDSDCLRILMELSGLPFDLVHNHTTMDAPETVRYIRSIPDIQIDYPATTIHQLIVKKHMPPTRIVRYCCSELKERGGVDRFVVTGVRWSESVKRHNRGIVEVQQRKLSDGLILNNDNDEDRRIFEHCQLKGKRVLNPIIDWSDGDVWEFLHYYGCESNPLYQCGYKRIGCVGCPMSYHRKAEFDKYPKFKQAYIKTFDRMLQSDFYKNNKASWNCGEEVFEWWVSDKQKKIEIDENQLTF
ncbi:MAG: phosphoadenosine phosphosulfate reductase family protein [Ruminococcus sp.]|nr:phosphoadenosine phosphosulfate reductase family protein [Ruminococcus sp.]MCM1380920.1 phosphoadenosine phosphosulfate reductase family protein [Muribaculaceae bacterium]